MWWDGPHTLFCSKTNLIKLVSDYCTSTIKQTFTATAKTISDISSVTGCGLYLVFLLESKGKRFSIDVTYDWCLDFYKNMPITNLMHWLLSIHKILYSSTCFEPQVLIFRRIQLYTCSNMVLSLSTRVCGGLSVHSCVPKGHHKLDALIIIYS